MPDRPGQEDGRRGGKDVDGNPHHDDVCPELEGEQGKQPADQQAAEDPGEQTDDIALKEVAAGYREPGAKEDHAFAGDVENPGAVGDQGAQPGQDNRGGQAQHALDIGNIENIALENVDQSSKIHVEFPPRMRYRNRVTGSDLEILCRTADWLGGARPLDPF